MATKQTNGNFIQIGCHISKNVRRYGKACDFLWQVSDQCIRNLSSALGNRLRSIVENMVSLFVDDPKLPKQAIKFVAYGAVNPGSVTYSNNKLSARLSPSTGENRSRYLSGRLSIMP